MPENETIAVDAPEIAGLAFRHLRGESDYPLMAAVLEASERPEEVLDEQYAGVMKKTADLDPFQDIIIAEVNGEMIGYGRIHSINEDAEERLYGLRCFLLAGWRRKGIGSAILRWLEARVREVDRERPHDRPVYLRIGAKQSQPELTIMLERAGYQPIRYFFVMGRPSLDDIPEIPLPPGIEVHPVLPEHYRAIWKSIGETAQDEWGYHPLTEEDYQAWTHSSEFQPHLWQIGWDTSTHEVAGAVLTFIFDAENQQTQRKRGYTEGIGVVPAWRKRGLATALIMRSLQAQKAAGMQESAMVVDSMNASGALGLYERCGFQVIERNAIYRKPLYG